MDPYNPNVDPQRWADAMKERRSRPDGRPPPLAPWEEMKWFDLPRCSVVGPPGSGDIQLVGWEPRRVVLMFAAVSQSSLIYPEGQPFVMSTGITISTTMLPMIFTQRDHGILCQSAWRIQPIIGASSVFVTEILLRDWP